MKRFTSLLLILAMILTAAYASAEGDYISIDAQIRTGDQEVQANLNIYPEEDRFYFTSSLIPDICIQLAGISPAETVNALSELIRNLNDDKITGIIRKCTAEWVAFMQPETRTGSFSGDAFDHASTMQHITFSCGDLMLLGQRIRKALRQQGASAVLLESDWSDLLMPERNIRFDLKIFDDGKYASLGVLDGEKTVMTVSANISESDAVLLVAGCGYGGKNYYSRILADQKDGRLDITETLYADDLKAGYPGLTADSLIYTRNSTIEWDAETVRFSEFLFPANEQMTPVTCSGTLGNVTSGRLFEGEIHFSGYDGFRATITADIKKGGIGEMPARIIDLDQADETELIGLGTEIGVAMLPILLQIIGGLPPEYSVPVAQIMNY